MEVSQTIKFLIKELKNILPKIKELIEKGTISESDLSTTVAKSYLRVYNDNFKYQLILLIII